MRGLIYTLLVAVSLFALYSFTKGREQQIFIIGDSTVRYDYDERRVGWGTALVNDCMKHPQNGFNEARRGATAQSYQEMNQSIAQAKGEAHWARTKALMNSADGYLLIQFGSNDQHQNVPKESFVKALKQYVNEAKEMGITPILISPPNTRLIVDDKLDNNRGEFPSYIEQVAEQEKVLYLNLHGKSMEEFSRLNQEQLDQQFGAIVYPNGRIDTTHFHAQGAKTVAGWVKALACEKERMLCKQFR